MVEVQVLIAAYGPDAMERIASLPHSAADGVEYIVSWQNHDKTRIPAILQNRPDFHIYPEESTGLCNNRNALLQRATAPWAVIADDDLAYHTYHFENLLKAIKENPDRHILTFRYDSTESPKTYPGQSFDLRQPPKGYFVTSMEIALNLALIKKDFEGDGLQFHTDFGVNGRFFGSGEEDILMATLLRKGYRGRYIPRSICLNTQSTTSERIGDSREFIETKGAVMLYVKPHSWPLRMLTHAWRSSVPFGRYCRWWLHGVRKARKNKVFER